MSKKNMILYKKFPYGRLGNSLFQYTFIRALSERTGIKWALPMWGGSQFFQMDYAWNEDDNIKINEEIKEPYFDYNKAISSPSRYDNKSNYNFKGYFQSEKYFNDVWDKIKQDFLFKEDFYNRFGGVDIKDTDWCMHVRRGDYVNHIKYVNLPLSYYNYFIKKYPDNKFYIFTDDYDYAVVNFKQNNVEVVDGYTAVESMCLMSKFKNHVIANSSYSWWGAKLAELYNKNVNVIRPSLFFRSDKEFSTGKDFYPDRWKVKTVILGRQCYIPDKKKKYHPNLNNVTFVIPVMYDSKDRMGNVKIILNYIKRMYNSRVILGSYGSGDMFKKFESDKVKHVKIKLPEWHRTKMLNEMIKMVETDIVVNLDSDVLIPTKQMISAFRYIDTDEADFVYPYDGRFINIDRVWCRRLLVNADMIDNFKDVLEDMKQLSDKSFGGCVVLNRKKFIGAGMENENFIGHAPEDMERYIRFKKLGYTIKRVDGCLYHINHFRGVNSTHKNIHRTRSKSELRRVTNMTKDELRKYVDGWSWCK